jgi:hypothetical protein
MKIRWPGRQRTAETSPAPDARSTPEPAPVTWTRAELRERIQHTGCALAAIHRQTRETDRPPLADREPRAVTTIDSNITHDMTPAEAANLLTKLEAGHQAAWWSTHKAPRGSAEYESRFQNAAEVDGVFRDLMWQTLDNGMRHPGESVQQFAERAETEARLTGAPTARTETTAGPISPQTRTEVTPQRAGTSPDENAIRLLSDPSTPLGQAYAKAFSDTAAVHVRELRRRDPLPEPDRTPGIPHPDPVLGRRGWHVNQHGIYTRRATPERQAPRENEPEAGS